MTLAKRLNAAILFAVLSWTVPALGSFRLGLMTGYGSGSLSSGGNKLGQGPLGMSFLIEKIIGPNYTLSLDHSRALSGAQGTIHFTGLTWRWFFIRAIPRPSPDKEEISTTLWYHRSPSPYLGLGTGYAVGQLEQHDPGSDVLVNGSGLYIVARFGFEYPFMGLLTWKIEGSYSTASIRNGSMRFIGGMIGMAISIP